jgi:signal peptidase
VLAPAAIGWQRYAIVSGSMTGTYDKGSLVVDDVVPVSSLKVGDVITYLPPAGDHLITHRLAWIGLDPTGARIFRTKGDANPVADPWTFKLDRPEQARVRFGVPYAGRVLTALGRRDVRLALIAFPAVLIAFFNLAGLWRRLGALEEAAA